MKEAVRAARRRLESSVANPSAANPARQTLSVVDCLESKIKPVLAAIGQRLRELGPELTDQQMPEYAALRMLEQMAVIAEAVVMLERHERSAQSHTPATALGRLAVEGLIYLNYLTADESQAVMRAMCYVACEIMWREAFEDRRQGRLWRRWHGAPPRKPPAAAGEFCLPVEQKHGRYVDDFERRWTLDDAKILQRNHGACLGWCDELVALASPRTPAEHLRERWNNPPPLGPTKKRWEEMNRRWNMMKEWPFGLKPKTAYEEGGLEERIRRLVGRESSSAEGSGQPQSFLALCKEWTSRVGLDLMSNFSHFSPARIAIDPRAFQGLAATLHLMSIRLAVRLLACHHPWADKLREEV